MKTTSESGQISAFYLTRINSGDLAVGERLPTVRAIAKEWGVARATAHDAVVELVKAGYVRTAGRHGSVVARRDLPVDGEPGMMWTAWRGQDLDSWAGNIEMLYDSTGNVLLVLPGAALRGVRPDGMVDVAIPYAALAHLVDVTTNTTSGPAATPD